MSGQRTLRPETLAVHAGRTSAPRTGAVMPPIQGPYHNVVKIRPPMPFNSDDADYLLEAFAQIMREDFLA